MNAQCASGFCVDGVCCAESSCPTGQRCNVPGSEGECVVSAACVGDCNDDGRVTVDELITGVNIALENVPVSACAALQCQLDSNLGVFIPCMVIAINNTLNGCPISLRSLGVRP